MAGETGLEPAASGVTGRRYNQLNYSPASDKAKLATGKKYTKDPGILSTL